MSRRALLPLAVALALILGLALWLLRPQTEAGSVAPLASHDRGGSSAPGFAALRSIAPAEPILVPATSGEPVPPPPAPIETEPKREMKLAIGVTMLDGKPAQPLLRRELPGFYSLSVVATAGPLGERLPDSIAPLYSCLGLGRFDRPLFAFDDPASALPGYIGTLQLPRTMSAYVSLSSGPIVLGTQPFQEGQESASFVIELDTLRRVAGSLRLLVLSATSHQPLNPALLRIGMQANLREDGKDPSLTLGDPHGVVEAHGLGPGPTQLWLTAPGYEECGFDAVIPVASTLDFGTIELQPATSIAGRVEFETGDPAPLAIVAVFLDDPRLTSSSVGGPFTRTKADAEGRFVFQGLGRRRYALVVFGGNGGYEDSHHGLLRVDATQGDVGDALVRLQLASSITVVNPAGRDGVMLRLRPAAAPFIDCWPARPYLASPGALSFSLLPDRYTLETTVAGWPTQTRTIELGLQPTLMTVTLGD